MYSNWYDDHVWFGKFLTVNNEYHRIALEVPKAQIIAQDILDGGFSSDTFKSTTRILLRFVTNIFFCRCLIRHNYIMHVDSSLRPSPVLDIKIGVAMRKTAYLILGRSVYIVDVLWSKAHVIYIFGHQKWEDSVVS